MRSNYLSALRLFLMFAMVAIGRPTLAIDAPNPPHTVHVSPAPLPAIAADQQFRTIGEAAKIVQPGDVVIIHSGVYRETVKVDASGTAAHPIIFAAAQAANVTITGADRLKDWKHEPGPDNIYSTDWQYSFVNYSPLHAHPDDDYHKMIGRAEQVFVRGYAMHPVLRREEMSRGSFFADLDGKRLYVWGDGNEDLTKTPVEASTRDVLWHATGAYVEARGIRFRYAANTAQEGAVQLAGTGDALRDCVVERTNGNGASFTAANLTVERCTFRENGQMGFGASHIDGSHIRDCIIQNNNIKDFDRGWEAGGEKIVLTKGAVIESCRVLDNRGVGLWFDIGNEDCEVHNCLIANNEDAGIFYEISYGLHAHDNVIIGNGLADSPGAWGAQAGICLSSSPGCVIERNLLVANREGFDFREQDRTTPRIGAPQNASEVAVWVHDETIRHNVLADNRDAQTWGWFDILDQEHWPQAMQEHTPDAGRAMANQAAAYVARGTRVRPGGLTLEKLHLTFSDNLYDAPDGQGLIHWGVSWRRNKAYDAIDPVHTDLHLEDGSRVAPFAFADYRTRDFRVPPDSPALKMNCYPQGEIPGAQMGIQTH